MEMLKESQPQELQIVRTYLEFREADLSSDGKFNIYASYMENLKIQPFNQTLIQKGAVWKHGYLHQLFNSLPIWPVANLGNLFCIAGN